MKKLKKIKGKRRSKEAGQIAQIIRRKMIQKPHSVKGYNRNKERENLRNDFFNEKM